MPGTERPQNETNSSVRGYYRDVRGDALRRTWRFTKEHLLAGAVLAVLGFGIQFGFQGTREAVGNLTSAVLFPLTAVGLAVISVLLWNLVRAPVLLAREKYDQADPLRARIVGLEAETAALRSAAERDGIARRLQLANHDLTSLGRGRIERWAEQHPETIPKDRPADWHEQYHGDASWRHGTVAEFYESGLRARIFALLDEAHAAGADATEALMLVRDLSAVSSMWRLRNQINAVMAKLRQPERKR